MPAVGVFIVRIPTVPVNVGKADLVRSVNRADVMRSRSHLVPSCVKGSFNQQTDWLD